MLKGLKDMASLLLEKGILNTLLRAEGKGIIYLLSINRLPCQRIVNLLSKH